MGALAAWIVALHAFATVVCIALHFRAFRLYHTLSDRYKFCFVLLSVSSVACLVRTPDPIGVLLDSSQRWSVFSADVVFCCSATIFCVFIYSESRFLFRLLKRVNGAQSYIRNMRNSMIILLITLQIPTLFLSALSLLLPLQRYSFEIVRMESQCPSPLPKKE